MLKHPAFIAVLGNELHLTVQLAGNLLTSPADRAAGAAVGEKQGRVIYFPSCAGKRPVHGRFTGFPGGGRRAVMRCRTVQQHTVDGVTIRYPPARGSRFTTPPPGGTSCFTTHRRRSGRRARPNFGQRYRCDNLSQPLPAGSVERVAWGPPSSRACGYPWALLAPIPSASSLPPGPLCGWFPARDQCRPAARSYSPLPFRFLFSSKN